MKKTLVKWFKRCVLKIRNFISPALSRQVGRRSSRPSWDNWLERTKDVVACPDNAYIPRVPTAGMILGDFQIMHNGIKVLVGSYYGKEPSDLLEKNRGVHEPQEERMFQEVLKLVPAFGVILELGAYWAFYSLWFCKAVPGGRAFLVEPVAENFQFGQRNFEANSLEGHFTRAFVGHRSGRADDGTRITCVDDFVAEHELERITILHSDIQGAELEMLKGSQKTIRDGKISYCFISTHNEDLHRGCARLLGKHRFVTLASICPSESFSYDGILVCSAPHAPQVPLIPLSRKNNARLGVDMTP
jgi:hypothetical protein